MKKIGDILYYFSLVLVMGGILLRTQGLRGGIFIIAGLLVFCIYNLKLLMSQWLKGTASRLRLILLALLVLMTVTIFAKYLYYVFWDYPSLIIVPSFVLFSIYYLFFEKSKSTKITVATIVFLLLTIPLFSFDFHKSPRKYIPQEWHNLYDVSKARKIELPYKFKSLECDRLSEEAFDLKNVKEFYSSIKIYRQALKLEPDNPRLYFELSECYARINLLEQAITMLDSAIIYDSSFSAFYCNRGLLYYKLKVNDKALEDYNKAILLDSTNAVAYANRALVFSYMNNFEKSCESLSKAEQLGFEIEDKELKWIKRKKCL